MIANPITEVRRGPHRHVDANPITVCGVYPSTVCGAAIPITV
jgi:hypothetical protein